MSKTKFVVSLPEDRSAQLVELSKKTGISVTCIIRNALYERLDKE